MANKINTPACATSYGNVGYGDCYLEVDKIVGAIQVPKNFSISESDLGTLQAFFEAKTQAAIGTRIFPYHNFTSIADNTEDVTINTTDYGAKSIGREGFYDFTFRYLTGGLLLHGEIQKNSGTGKYFLFYDDAGILYGYIQNGRMEGIPVDVFYAPPFRWPTGADSATYNLRFIINPRYMNRGNIGYIKIDDFNMYDIQGLQALDIRLYSLVGNTVKVRMVTKVSAEDMHAAYGANFSEVTAWKAENEDGTVVPITSVTIDNTIGGWTIVLNGTLFYQSDKIYLRTAAADVLAAAPISVSGFEGNDPLTIEGPVS